MCMHPGMDLGVHALLSHLSLPRVFVVTSTATRIIRRSRERLSLICCTTKPQHFRRLLAAPAAAAFSSRKSESPTVPASSFRRLDEDGHRRSLWLHSTPRLPSDSGAPDRSRTATARSTGRCGLLKPRPDKGATTIIPDQCSFPMLSEK